MKRQSLEDRIQSFGGAVKMLRSAPDGAYSFPVPSKYSSFLEDQRAWHETVVLTDMGQHMHCVTFKGQDVHRLFSELCVNSFDGFGRGKAKQFVMVREDGFLIGDGVVVGLEDDEYELLVVPTQAHWLEYQAQQRGYDVTVTEDPPTGINTGERRFYRYQVHGPLALEVMEKAIGGKMPDVKFFHMADITIDGLAVRAISHTMSRKPGFELFGPRSEGPRILAALRVAGGPFGMREMGSASMPTQTTESGWYPLPVPAIYSGEDMKPFREWLNGYGFESFISLAGSCDSENIDDYYVTPYDLNFDHIIKFDHDFIGRAALEKMAANPPKRRKVYLRWDNGDAGRLLTEALMGSTPRPRLPAVPYSTYAGYQNDKVLSGGNVVGVSGASAYTINQGGWVSLAIVDSEFAKEGQELELLWGDSDTSLRQPPVENTKLTKIKVTVTTKSPVQ